MMSDYILEMQNITKSFSGVKALDNLSLKVKRGEILSLCGENGAGKSTLMKVLSGIHPYGSFEGKIIYNGKEQINKHIKDSEKVGISIIHQELNLVHELSILENLFLGSYLNNAGFMNYARMEKIAIDILKQLKLDKSPGTKIRDLGVGEQQLVEIAKALLKNAKLLILDEPTAPLTDTEVAILKNIIFDLKHKGVTCIYISHKLPEVMELSDEIAVIRDGKFIGAKRKTDITQDEIIRMMVGRDLSNLYPRDKHKIGDEVVLEVRNFKVHDKENPKKLRVKNANFTLRKGEILGVAGLIGSGRTELVSSIYGSYEGKYSGECILLGKKVKIRSSRDSIYNGIAMVPEDRKKHGIIGIMSVRENLTLSNLKSYGNSINIIKQGKELKDVNDYTEKLKVKAANFDISIKSLSGGNQQKVVIGKNLLTNPKILILDEPTRGIDVGAKYEIYKDISQLARQGISIIMVSSELPEILGMSDRVMVMHEGELKGILDNKELTQEIIMKTAIGTNHERQ